MQTKKIVILGGTGTLGTEILNHFKNCSDYCSQQIKSTNFEIKVISRDEAKQQDLKKKYPNVTFQIGDIRDYQNIYDGLRGADIVFHVAALKHIDIVESNIHEAMLTNVIGSINVAKAAIERGVKKVIFSSTDKAVLPINAYGMMKAISEKYYKNLQSEFKDTTDFYVFRWGNVMGSRGSVIHSFAESLEKHRKIFLTDLRMTRFWINISDAVSFMFSKLDAPSSGEVLYPEMKAASVYRVAHRIALLKGIENFDISYIGLRPGEKIHECLESNNQFNICSDTAPMLSDFEIDAMLRKIL